MPIEWLTAQELTRGYLSREFSPVDVVSHLIERIDRVDPLLHSFVSLQRDQALRHAEAAGKEIMKRGLRGRLHGVPVGIKDMIDVEGVPTTCQSRLLLTNVASRDAFVVKALRDAGAIIMGKMATHEFATGGPGSDLPFPPARNPWNTEHHPGGSSSGCGAGVAGGLVPIAIGTDSGGSVRHPATACGLVGLKPTNGLISRDGVFPLSFSQDSVGFIARSAGDIGLALDSIVADRRQSTAVTPGKASSAALKGLKVGVIWHFSCKDMTAKDEINSSIEYFLQFMARNGANVGETAVSRLQLFSNVNDIILRSEAWSIHRQWIQHNPEMYGQFSRVKLLSGAFLSASDYIDAMRIRPKLAHEVSQRLQQYDVLVCASSMDLPCRISDLDELNRTYGREARNPFNVTGHPAITFPIGVSATGLPMSVQLICNYYMEDMLLHIAEFIKENYFNINWEELIM